MLYYTVFELVLKPNWETGTTGCMLREVGGWFESEEEAEEAAENLLPCGTQFTILPVGYA